MMKNYITTSQNMSGDKKFASQFRLGDFLYLGTNAIA